MNYDTKKYKRYKQNKVICWVCFNVHKYPENHYRKILLLFKPFVNLKNHLEKLDILWKDAYLSEKY